MVVPLGCFLSEGGSGIQGQNCPLRILDGEKAPCLKNSQLGRYYNVIKIYFLIFFNLSRLKCLHLPSSLLLCLQPGVGRTQGMTRYITELLGFTFTYLITRGQNKSVLINPAHDAILTSSSPDFLYFFLYVFMNQVMCL